MPLMKFKPTSAGRRSAVRVVTPDLHKGAPHAPLLEKQSKTGGRNHHGRITTRHIGGGHKQHYRLIDFKRANPWVAGLDVLPFNVIYVGGEKKSEFAGSGVPRLENRLRMLLRDEA